MWTRSDGITDSEQRAIAARQTGDARCDLIQICEAVAKALPKGIADDRDLGAFAEALCELVKDDCDLSLAFDPEARVSAYDLAAEAMVRVAGRPRVEQGEAA